MRSMGAIEEMESAQGGWLFLSGGRRGCSSPSAARLPSPKASDDGRSAGHSRSVPPERNNHPPRKPATGSPSPATRSLPVDRRPPVGRHVELLLLAARPRRSSVFAAPELYMTATMVPSGFLKASASPPVRRRRPWLPGRRTARRGGRRSRPASRSASWPCVSTVSSAFWGQGARRVDVLARPCPAPCSRRCTRSRPP